MKESSGKFRALSKYGKLHFDQNAEKEMEDIESILSEIRSIDRGNGATAKKRKSYSRSSSLSKRLLNNEKVKRKSHKLTKPRTKPKKNTPTFPQATFKDSSENDVPASDQYDPDFKVTLPRDPAYSINDLPKEVSISPDQMTMAEMVNTWEKEIRVVNPQQESKEEASHDITNKGTILEQKEKQTKSLVPGIIGRTSKQQKLFTAGQDTPGPGKYNIQRNSDPVHVVPFSGQSSRPEIDPGPDRTHFNLAKSIDATKPRSIYHTLPPKLGHSDKETPKKSIWAEIEDEQKEFLDIIHKQKSNTVNTHPVKQRKITIKPRPGPFDHLMHTEAPDVEYNVEESLKMLESTKIPPRTNFGRRLDDSDRTIYAKSDAPDIIYTDLNKDYLATRKRTATSLDFKKLPERLSPYDYMPKPCGGDYDYYPEDFDYRTGISFDLMGERQIMLELPPQFTQKRTTSQLIDRFKGHA